MALIIDMVTNSTGPESVPLDSHPNALVVVERGPRRLMPNLDMDMAMDTVMDMVLDTAMDMLA